MRTLSVFNAAETSKTETEPFYLAHIGFDTPLYLCSLKTITISSITWSGSRRFKLSSLKTDPIGNQSGMFQLSDVDNLISNLILNEGCAGKSLDIYKGYGVPADDSEIIREFTGFMDDSDISDESVSIKIIGKSSTRYTPNIYITPPLFNHLPPSGTVIKSGNNTIILESRR